MPRRVGRAPGPSLVHGSRRRRRCRDAIGMVVAIGTDPATIIVAPKSPRARPNAIATPATMPRRASGNVTSSAIRHREQPHGPSGLLETGVDTGDRGS